MADSGIPARRAAARLLDEVLGRRQMLAQAAADPKGPLGGLEPPDRARAQRLATAALRRLEQIDRVLAQRMRKAPPAAVRNILRIAVAELAQGAAPHGVVNAAVAAVHASGRKAEPYAGLVNAVLRNLPAADELFQAMAPPMLPRWLRQPLVRAWGRDAVASIEAVQMALPPLDLTLRPGATSHPMGEILPTGSLRLAELAQVSALQGYDSGDWWVQDAAAALPARLLAPQKGERILDLCAAPGGKTMQLAAAGADVTALDISAPRLERCARNLARTGLSARLVLADALEWAPDGGGYDAVLLDAPCSATGTIRRHPDLPFVKDGSELPALVALQARMLDRALGFLRPGGRIVFATCSLLPEEGEAQLRAALDRHPGLRVDPGLPPGIDPAWISAAGGLRLRPDHWADRGGIDGFFMVRLSLSLG